MPLDAVEHLQRRVIGVLAVIARWSEVVINAAGERSYAIDAAGSFAEVEKRAESGVVGSFGQQVQHALFILEQIRAALAALPRFASRALAHFRVAKGIGKDAPAEILGGAVDKGDLTRPVAPRPVRVDDEPFQPFQLPLDRFVSVFHLHLRHPLLLKTVRHPPEGTAIKLTKSALIFSAFFNTLPSNVGANLVYARVQRDSDGNGEQ